MLGDFLKKNNNLFLILGLIFIILFLLLIYSKSNGFANLVVNKSNSKIAVESNSFDADKSNLEISKKQINKENIIIEYNYEKPILTKNSENKDQIKISKLNNLNIPGEPEIPFEVAMILLPVDKDVDEISVIPEKKIELKGNYDIKTGDWQFPLSVNYSSEELSKKIEEFEENKPAFSKYPINYYSNPSTQVKKGFRFAIFNLYPVEYNQKDKKLYYYSKFTIVITLKTNDVPKTLRLNNKEDLKEIKEWVISQNSTVNSNSYSFEKYKSDFKNISDKTNLSALDSYIDYLDSKNIPNQDTLTYKYILITKREFGDSFQPLIDWKNTRPNNPITAKIYYIEDILADPRFSCTGEFNWGDGCGLFNQFDDNAARVRNFIRYAYINNTEYILLGGDADSDNLGSDTETEEVIVPSRYIGTKDYNPVNPYEFTPIIVSDVYYSNLDGSFNIKNDGVFRFYYGDVNYAVDPPETFPDSDYLTDISIGRAPFDNNLEISNWINKVILNEQLINEQDLNHLFVGEFMGYLYGPSAYASIEMDQIISGFRFNNLNTVGFSEINENNIYRLYDYMSPIDSSEEGVFSTSDLINLINLINPYVITHEGHGNTNRLLKLNSPFSLDGPTSLLNANRFFINSQACYSGAFDNTDPLLQTNPFDSISEHLLGLENGPFSVITNSRYGWIGKSIILQRTFWDTAFLNTKKNIGFLNNLSKEHFILTENNSVNSSIYLAANLLGDPETSLKLPVVNNILSVDFYNLNFDSQDYLISETNYQEDLNLIINVRNLTETIQNSTLHIYFDNQEINSQVITLNSGDNQISYTFNHNLYEEYVGESKIIKIIIDPIDSEAIFDNSVEKNFYIYNIIENSTYNLNNLIVDCNTSEGQDLFGINTNKIAITRIIEIQGENLVLKNCEIVANPYSYSYLELMGSNIVLENNIFKQINVNIMECNNIIIRNNRILNNYFKDNYKFQNKTAGNWDFDSSNFIEIYSNNVYSFRDLTQINYWDLDYPKFYFWGVSNVNIFNNIFNNLFNIIGINNSEDFNISNNNFNLSKRYIFGYGADFYAIKSNNNSNLIIQNNRLKNMDFSIINSDNINLENNLEFDSKIFVFNSQDVFFNNNILRNPNLSFGGFQEISPTISISNSVFCGPPYNYPLLNLTMLDCNDLLQFTSNFTNNLVNSINSGVLESMCPNNLPLHGVNFCYCGEKFNSNGVGCISDPNYQNTIEMEN